MTSSKMPSAKNSFSGSELRFRNGRTATEGCSSGPRGGTGGVVDGLRVEAQVPAPEAELALLEENAQGPHVAAQHGGDEQHGRHHEQDRGQDERLHVTAPAASREEHEEADADAEPADPGGEGGPGEELERAVERQRAQDGQRLAQHVERHPANEPRRACHQVHADGHGLDRDALQAQLEDGLGARRVRREGVHPQRGLAAEGAVAAGGVPHGGSGQPADHGAAQLLERAVDLFATAGERNAATPDVKALHAKIGQLAMENDFLAGALGRIPDASAKR